MKFHPFDEFSAYTPDSGLSWMHAGVVVEDFYIIVFGGVRLPTGAIRYMDTRTERWTTQQVSCKMFLMRVFHKNNYIVI